MFISILPFAAPYDTRSRRALYRRPARYSMPSHSNSTFHNTLVWLGHKHVLSSSLKRSLTPRLSLSCHGRMAPMPVGGQLKRVTGADEHVFREMGANELHAKRHPF
jgi:hypothetical protein